MPTSLLGFLLSLAFIYCSILHSNASANDDAVSLVKPPESYRGERRICSFTLKVPDVIQAIEGKDTHVTAVSVLDNVASMYFSQYFALSLSCNLGSISMTLQTDFPDDVEWITGATDEHFQSINIIGNLKSIDKLLATIIYRPAIQSYGADVLTLILSANDDKIEVVDENILITTHSDAACNKISETRKIEVVISKLNQIVLKLKNPILQAISYYNHTFFTPENIGIIGSDSIEHAILRFSCLYCNYYADVAHLGVSIMHSTEPSSSSLFMEHSSSSIISPPLSLSPSSPSFNFDTIDRFESLNIEDGDLSLNANTTVLYLSGSLKALREASYIIKYFSKVSTTVQDTITVRCIDPTNFSIVLSELHFYVKVEGRTVLPNCN